MESHNDEAYDNLTQIEWMGLGATHNLADGHARLRASRYETVIREWPAALLVDDGNSQVEVQHAFEQAFFALAREPTGLELDPLYCYSCSLAIEVVANFLRNCHHSVSLIHPTFDNLGDILARHKLNPIPLEESRLAAPDLRTDEWRSGAIFIVEPNNPTGSSMTPNELASLAEHCRVTSKILIIDFSFRFFSSKGDSDHYGILRSSGVSFIGLEDTGKSWSARDLKTSMIVASDDLRPALKRINDDMLLNVSPAMLALLTSMMSCDLDTDGRPASAEVVESNRETLRSCLSSGQLGFEGSDRVSVEWLRLPEGWSSREFCSWARGMGVHVLPGGPFFWADLPRGDSFIRVALGRDERSFARAAERLVALVDRYQVRVSTRSIGKDG